MTIQDILTLSRAGFTAQQIAQMSQPVQTSQPVQQVPQQMVQQVPQQVVQQVPQQVTQQVTQPTSYIPVLPPQGQQTFDPMKDVMLQQYSNPQGVNMYNVHDIVADMIGAIEPTTPTGGAK